jgi:hypothetical protein
MKTIPAILVWTESTFHSLHGGPTSVYWTNCTTEIQKTGEILFSFVDYFPVCHQKHSGTALPADYSLLTGLEWKGLQGEIGFDIYSKGTAAWTLNAKIGIEEDKLFHRAPAFNIGFFNVGAHPDKKGSWAQNVVNFIIGKDFSKKKYTSHLYASFYSGSRALGRNRQGFMAGWLAEFSPKTYKDGREYKQWFLGADYASGKNAIGGGGISCGYYFTPDVYLQTGPVWFNTTEYNGKWKWGIQLYYNFSIAQADKKTDEPKKGSCDQFN